MNKYTTENYYNDEQAKTIMKEIPNIIKSSTIKQLEITEPTLNERLAVFEAIKTFVKNNGNIIYGRYALNELIKSKNKNEVIYESYIIPTVEFYSYNIALDLKNLCDILYEKGFKYVVGEKNIISSVSVNFLQYCYISYVPEIIYKKLNFIQINGIKCIDPQFMIINHFKIFNSPLISYNHLESSFSEFVLLQKYYPFILNGQFNNSLIEKVDKIDKTSSANKLIDLIINEYMRKNNQSQESLVITGIHAYNIYMKSIKNKNELPVEFIELISNNYHNDIENMIDFIKKNLSISGVNSKNDSRITWKEYYPFLDLFNQRTEIFLDNKKIICIHHNNNNCIPYIVTSKEKKIVTYSYLLMMFMIYKFKMSVDDNIEYYNYYDAIVNYMIFVRYEYFKSTNTGPLDNTVFKDFNINCNHLGEIMTPERKNKLNIMSKIENKKIPVIRYYPDKKMNVFDISKEGVINIAGNEILIDKGTTKSSSEYSEDGEDGEDGEVTSLTE